mmetsp:Transcript_4836/g.10672  ORF Transcript_4836/g.10672 Transcript_4836/m.10672 type:complete len:229 (-) Transcript_4836:353-1039(-)
MAGDVFKIASAQHLALTAAERAGKYPTHRSNHAATQSSHGNPSRLAPTSPSVPLPRTNRPPNRAEIQPRLPSPPTLRLPTLRRCHPTSLLLPQVTIRHPLLLLGQLRNQLLLQQRNQRQGLRRLRLKSHLQALLRLHLKNRLRSQLTSRHPIHHLRRLTSRRPLQSPRQEIPLECPPVSRPDNLRDARRSNLPKIRRRNPSLQAIMDGILIWSAIPTSVSMMATRHLG